MKIAITVSKQHTLTGYDHAKYRGEYPVINTVIVRRPNENRVKGEPHEIVEYFDVRCIKAWDKDAKNQIGRLGAFTNLKDDEKINEIVERYKKMGDVTVIYN